MKRIVTAFSATLILLALLTNKAGANPFFKKFKFIADSPQVKGNDTLRYPIYDRYGDGYSNGRRNPFDLKDTGYIKRDIQYDPKTKSYYIVEKIGNQYYRTPTYLTFDEFMRLRAAQMERENFQKRANTNFSLNRKLMKPKLRVTDDLFNRIFGNGKIEIKPAGNVDLLLGYQGQNTKNPTLPERARKYGAFDFDMNAQFNMNANIGDKLKFPINYNTLANFDFENQIKLDYKGKDDEIIKAIEAGNLSWASRGTLIPGAQSLFGIKTQLQFGKLFVTGVLANQKSQRQTQNIQGGAAAQSFEKKLDDYEENRHFLLGHYFRNNFNKVMSTLPVANSRINIMRIEVWVTNRTGQTTDSRDVVGFMDLGEPIPYNPNITSVPPLSIRDSLPKNESNGLYSTLVSNPNFRNPSNVTALLGGRGLKPVEDFERTYGRKLIEGQDYIFNRQAGFISVNQFLQPDEVLGVAYQYTYNGKAYQVGEFSQDVALDSTQGIQKVLFLKLLKGTSQRPNLPLWDLMMKNVYSLDMSNIQREDFKLNILYQEPSGGEKRFLPEGDDAILGLSLLRILQLDRLNNRLDPQPDGLFDYIDSFTIQPQQGRIIFPVLEPFGSDLRRLAFATTPALGDKYAFNALYDTIKTIAQQNYAQFNRFLMRGTSKGSAGDDIYLNGINIPQGSVTLTAGGNVLVEGVDYTIDYNLGKVTIINSAIKASGLPVSINYENNAGFGIQNRGFMGFRMDYLANKKLSVGASVVRLSERPFFTKQNYGEDPIRNTMFGVDFNYRSEWKKLTRLLDKLPFYSTTATSSIQAYGEAALLKPGHPPQIGKGEEGLIYLDDFEGTRANIDLRFPFVGWTQASTPQDAGFPEANRINDLSYGYNRARFAWYQVEPVLQDPKEPNNPIKDRNLLSDPRVRQVSNSELFPQRSAVPGFNQLITFDLAYYPKQRGVYNYDARPGSVGSNGELLNPKTRWGGLMRNIDQTDFESSNIEFLEFWVQDPFLRNAQFPNGYTNPAGGQLYINFGNISEDILKDSRRFYENGLPTPSQPTLAVDSTTVWGKAPVNPLQVTTAFSNDPADRPFQDVGLDGLNDDEERRRRDTFLINARNIMGAGSAAFQQLQEDPSSDNFVNYRDGRFGATTGIMERYKRWNGNQGNSAINTGDNLVTASTLYPDNEDLNRDNTLNEAEEYFEYKIDILPNMQVGTNFITDKRNVPITYANGQQGTEVWYQFRVPIQKYTRKVGNIPDFKSIRFMRMYMTGFEDSTLLRFARLDLVRNQWRNFAYEITRDGTYNLIPNTSPTTFNTLAVNIEENDRRTPVPYVIPPGIERVQSLATGGVNILQNEQALSMQFRYLLNKDVRGVFKTFNNNLNQYKKLSMFVHAEALPTTSPGYTPLRDKDINAVVRIGQDYLSNYYEIRVPLKITPPTTTRNADTIWPSVNNLDFQLETLVDLKNRRNRSNISPGTYYADTLADGRIYGVYGNPNLAEVKGIFIGVENPEKLDGPTLGGEVWINELRLSQLDEDIGWAALARVDMQLADLGTLTVSGSHSSVGFGTIEQRVNERNRFATTQFDAALTVDLGKITPKAARLSIPVYASVSTQTKTPQYDPYNKDVKLKDVLKDCNNCDSIRSVATEQTNTQVLSVQNLKQLPKPGKKQQLWSLSNFDISYNFFRQTYTSPIVTQDLVKRHRAVLGYQYSSQPKYIEPFKNWKNKSKWLTWIKDINLNPLPQSIAFRFDVNRQFGRFVPRIVNTFDNKVERVDSTYDKYFNFDRFYTFRWDLTKSFNIDYTATNKARVDEPAGELYKGAKRDSMWSNFWSGGRNVSYDQRVIFSYNLPTAKFPFLDWTTARMSYTAQYRWLASSLVAQYLNQGNILENGADKNVNAELDFVRLYSKSRWLSALDNPPAEAKLDSATRRMRKLQKQIAKLEKDSIEAHLAKLPPKERALARKQAKLDRRNERKSRPIEIGGVARIAGRLVTMVKRASINYGEIYQSRIPGYLDSTVLLGNNWKSKAPGFGYILGKQPDTAYLSNFARRGLMTKNPDFNLLYSQGFDQKLSIQAQLEPFKEFTIDVNLDKTFTKNFQELFKDTTGTAGHAHLSPYVTGGFSVSYIAFQTLFQKFDPNETSATFKRFENYRQVLSQRLGAKNTYGTGAVNPDGYAEGYSRYAQDVLIPSFIAAYTNKDPNTVGLIKNDNPKINDNPFKSIKPLPNWRVNFTGLTKIESIAKTFSAITVTHSYQSRLSMNSFNSSLLFQDRAGLGFPSFRDTVSGNYVPYFLVPNLTITEAFEPLIGIDITTVGQLNARVEYKKSRQLSLSLVDYQLSEINSTEYSLSASWRKRGLRLPFELPKFLNKDGGKKLENDLTFRLDFSVRDDATSNSRLDQNSSFSTAGQKVIKINPSIDYVMNNRVNIRLYFDQLRSIPYISTAAPTVNTRAGLQLRISLAQ